MLHGAIFLATCNAILLLRDVKLPNTSLHYTPPVNSNKTGTITRPPSLNFEAKLKAAIGGTAAKIHLFEKLGFLPF